MVGCNCRFIQSREEEDDCLHPDPWISLALARDGFIADLVLRRLRLRLQVKSDDGRSVCDWSDDGFTSGLQVLSSAYSPSTAADSDEAPSSRLEEVPRARHRRIRIRFVCDCKVSGGFIMKADVDLKRRMLICVRLRCTNPDLVLRERRDEPAVDSLFLMEIDSAVDPLLSVPWQIHHLFIHHFFIHSFGQG